MWAHNAPDRDVQGGVKILLTSLSPALALGSNSGRSWGVEEHQGPWPDAARVKGGDHHLLNMERDYLISETILLAHGICIKRLPPRRHGKLRDSQTHKGERVPKQREGDKEVWD